MSQAEPRTKRQKICSTRFHTDSVFTQPGSTASGAKPRAWGLDGGPIHSVSYGQRDFSAKAMIHAIYQVPATRRPADERASAAADVADLIPRRPESDR